MSVGLKRRWTLEGSWDLTGRPRGKFGVIDKTRNPEAFRRFVKAGGQAITTLFTYFLFGWFCVNL